MSVVRIVNKLGSHVFINSIDKNVPPKGSLTISRSQYEADPDLKAIESMGYVSVEEVQSEKAAEAPEEPAAAEEAPQEAESSEQEPEEPPYRTSEFTDEMAAKPAAKAAIVATPDGPKEAQPIDFGTPAHLKDRLGNKEAALPDGKALEAEEKPEEKEKKYIDGIEIIDTTADEPEHETIDGIEIVDTNKADHEELGDQFIEKIDSDNTATDSFPPNKPRPTF